MVVSEARYTVWITMEDIPKTPSRRGTASSARGFIALCLAFLAGFPMTHSSIADTTPSTSAITASQLTLGVSLLKKRSVEQNLAVSPYSIHAGLMLARVGALGETGQQLDKVLGTTPFSSAALESYRMLNQHVLQKDDKTSVTLANSIWITNTGAFKKEYAETITESLSGSAHSIDFSDPERARAEINSWVSQNTASRIPALLPAGVITRQSISALVNALHFKATWDNPFSVDGTMPDTFTVGPGITKQVQMMQHLVRVRYYEDETWQAAELPYSGGTYSFFVLVPKANLTPAQVVDDLSDALWRKTFENTGVARVSLRLPRFNVRQSQDLVTSLSALGLAEIFSPSGDFSGITTLPLKISAVQHESFIEVDEKGTEGAAATAVVFAKGAAPFGQEEIKDLIANHPFAFAIVHNATRAPLFLGVVGDPQ